MRSLQLRARFNLLGFAVVVAAAAALVVGLPAAAAAAGPAAKPAHAHAQSRSLVLIWWPDGTSESVRSNAAPSHSLLDSVTAARARSEGRVGVRAVTAASLRSLATVKSGGATACALSVTPPSKAGPSTVVAFGNLMCTIDVTQVSGSLGLYRGAGWAQIGIDYELYSTWIPVGDKNYFGNWQVSGTCARGTYDYNSYISVVAQSIVNGARGQSLPNGPSRISC